MIKFEKVLKLYNAMNFPKFAVLDFQYLKDYETQM